MTTGFLLVDKPAGPTSHDVVDQVRRRLDERRVGHAGTLDPPATGLLVVAVGAATRLLRYVQGLPKTYEARGVLGVRTSTLDASGDVVSTADVDADETALRAALATLTGEIDQVPPAMSAVKVDGRRAYSIAARGGSVDLAPRRVVVYELSLLSFEPPAFDVLVRCSAGTYVRSLVSDAGDRLGCGAHVASLRRTAIGHLGVEDASDAVLPVELVLSHMPRLDVDAPTAARLRNGQRVAAAAAAGDLLVVSSEGPVGVVRSDGGILRPTTMLPLTPPEAT